MSDHSSSTGSSGSSTNSWTLLSPEEVAVDNGGALDDGTESLGDAPSLSEDMAAGVAGENKPSDIPVECVLSEEGHQVCQETAPESGDGHALCSPLQPEQSEAPDPESRAPVIHDIVTSSPRDNEHPGAAFVCSLDFGVPRDLAEPDDTFREADNALADEPEPAVTPAETVGASEPPWHGGADVNRDQPEPLPGSGSGSGPADAVKAPESLASMQVEDEEEDEDPPEFDVQEEQEGGGESPTGHPGDGPRRRTLRSGPNAADVEDEDDEEEMDFWLPERKEEEKAWWSANKCAAGAAVLLFLGVLFLCGNFDAGDVSDAEQSQKDADAQGITGFFLTDEMSAEFQAVLDMFDTDGSGDISGRELGTVMRMLGENPLRRQLSDIIKAAKEGADKLDEGQGPKADGGGNGWRPVWEHLEKIRREISEGAEHWNQRRRKDPEKRRKDERERRDEWEAQKPRRWLEREQRRKEKPWRAKDPARFWRAQEHKLRRPSRPRRCASVDDCAAQEGLFPVELADFQELLEGYLDKLEGSPAESKDVLRRLVADFFSGGVFVHRRRPFADFAEDVADILEDMADVAGGADDALEEAMEEFEREALWKFAAGEQD